MTTFQVGKISAKQTESVKKGDMMLPKGCQKRIIMVNRPGSRYFESAYFVLKSGLPRSVSERDMLREAELLPFRAGIEAGAGMIMVSHMSAPAVTGDNTPCDLSPVIVTDLLRTELGYDGVVITDAHNMGAITANYTPGEAALLAIEAGCDLILMPDDLDAALQALRDAAADGTLTEARIDESVLRILTLKAKAGLLG